MEELSASGLATSELIFLDHASLWGQLGLFPGPHRPASFDSTEKPAIVIARNDGKEQANLAAYQRWLQSFNARDAGAIATASARELVWSDLALADDLDRRSAIAFFDSIWKGFSNLEVASTSSWAAGDYVVAVGTITGTNDGDVRALQLKKTAKPVSLPYLEISKFTEGKLVASWFFYDGLGLAAQLGVASM